MVVGAGGLGSPVAMYLAAAGIGTLGVVDSDVVDPSNLHRQLLHGSSDVGRRKVDSAADRLADVNPHTSVEAYDERLTPDNALELLGRYDIVVDCSDSFATRYLVNDACVLLCKPMVYGSISRFSGQASVFVPPDGPCYRCVFREPPPAGLIPNCAEAGVLGVLPGLVGTIQATEVLKLILGIGQPLIGRLLLVDSLSMDFRSIRLRRDPECPACGTDAERSGGRIRDLSDRADDYIDATCSVGADDGSHTGEFGRARGNGSAGLVREITAEELAAMIDRGDDFDLIDVREPAEWQHGFLPGARLVPLGRIAAVAAEGSDLDPDRDIVLYCKAGVRSRVAAEQLMCAGFGRVVSLAGGVMGWSGSWVTTGTDVLPQG